MVWFLCMCEVGGLLSTYGENFMSAEPLEIYLLENWWCVQNVLYIKKTVPSSASLHMLRYMTSNREQETLGKNLIQTHSITNAVRVNMFEATAVEALLHISLGALRVVPAHLQQVVLEHRVKRNTKHYICHYLSVFSYFMSCILFCAAWQVLSFNCRGHTGSLLYLSFYFF